MKEKLLILFLRLLQDIIEFSSKNGYEVYLKVNRTFLFLKNEDLYNLEFVYSSLMIIYNIIRWSKLTGAENTVKNLDIVFSTKFTFCSHIELSYCKTLKIIGFFQRICVEIRLLELSLYTLL